MEYSDKFKDVVHDDKNIKGFCGEYSFLSNFYPEPVEFEGLLYPSSEHAYQAAKCKDISQRKQFLGITPGQAKRLGRKVEIREDWEKVKKDTMHEILVDKFKTSGVLNRLLYGTGDKYLEETNWWNDAYWGVCNGKGENNLGKILMKIRSSFDNPLNYKHE